MISNPPVIVGHRAIPDEQFERLVAVVRAAIEFQNGPAYTKTRPLVDALDALTPDDIKLVQE